MIVVMKICKISIFEEKDLCAAMITELKKRFVRKIKLGVLAFFEFLGAFSKQIILFESYPDFDGSPWMIYQELKNRGYEKKYRLVWAVDKSLVPPQKIECIPFFGNISLYDRFRRFRYKVITKLIIDSNRYIEKTSLKTFRLHTRHGGTLKRVDQYSHAIGKIDYILSLSSEMACLESSVVYKGAGLDREQFLPLGYPNNDRLFIPLDQSVIRPWEYDCNNVRYKKIIGWMPTFRRHKFGHRVDCSKKFPFGVPLLYQREAFEKLNDFLKEKGVLLALKIHHAQLDDFPKVNFSNIKIIPQDLLSKLNVSMMDLIKSFDALITDYSSIYHEYLLLNRPIALTIDDFEEYSAGTGFSIDYFEWIKGVYLNDVSDLTRFVDEVSENIDSAKNERNLALHRIHAFVDNQSTKRVVDFLAEKIPL